MTTTLPQAAAAAAGHRPVRDVAVVGWGAIGRVVGTALAEGALPGARLTRVVDNRPLHGAPAPQADLAEALAHCDLVVEAAGQGFIRDLGTTVLTSGTDLLIASTGALTDPELAREIAEAGPGRVYYTGGAVGGLDLLQAVRGLGDLTRVRLTTAKLPATLHQPWMDAELTERLRTATGPVEVMRGTARDVPARFPRSTNVAATVALAVGDPDRVEVRVVADPGATLTRHVVEAEGPHGHYRFEVNHAPDAANPATSQVVPHAVLRSLAALTGRGGQIL
ncbi:MULTISPECIES: aspartate dehydrogenase domain-containing protein [Streptomyces]|uniref:aspartate dehydrogenase domain-containing protein n=1 Tax=Streptomyces TaxID=1883 RepID=UPI000EF90C53|nr:MULTISPECIES: aspartate dehydrogenase domain-containing protein [Streptomyces]RZD74081.1 aspartate dehydrogenase [Streptomyces albidoflavus]